MNPMGPPAPNPQMGPPAPAGGGGGMNDTMYQARLAEIKAMPPGPEQEAALAALARDYKGEQTAASKALDFGAEQAMAGPPKVTQTGGRFGTTVAANPLEHLASGLRTYKGYKDVGEAKDSMKGMSKDKQQALIDMMRSVL